MARNNQHVVPHGQGWAVRSPSHVRVSGTFRTQKEAIEYARDAARSQGTELVIHGRDGRIREKSSYGTDSFPPRG